MDKTNFEAYKRTMHDNHPDTFDRLDHARIINAEIKGNLCLEN